MLEGSHKTKVHLRVKTLKGSDAWCGQHTRYSMDTMEPEAFNGLPDHRKCRRCAKAFVATSSSEQPQ